jgi:hypothetical protein
MESGIWNLELSPETTEDAEKKDTTHRPSTGETAAGGDDTDVVRKTLSSVNHPEM